MLFTKRSLPAAIPKTRILARAVCLIFQSQAGLLTESMYMWTDCAQAPHETHEAECLSISSLLPKISDAVFEFRQGAFCFSLCFLLFFSIRSSVPGLPESEELVLYPVEVNAFRNSLK
jgi:hypothetical protein